MMLTKKELALRAALPLLMEMSHTKQNTFHCHIYKITYEDAANEVLQMIGEEVAKRETLSKKERGCPFNA